MLLDKKVTVKWHHNNRDWYEGLGYKFTKYRDTFQVRQHDLPKGSNIRVDLVIRM